jgi:hypothetical protein
MLKMNYSYTCLMVPGFVLTFGWPCCCIPFDCMNADVLVDEVVQGHVLIFGCLKLLNGPGGLDRSSSRCRIASYSPALLIKCHTLFGLCIVGVKHEVLEMLELSAEVLMVTFVQTFQVLVKVIEVAECKLDLNTVRSTSNYCSFDLKPLSASS